MTQRVTVYLNNKGQFNHKKVGKWKYIFAYCPGINSSIVTWANNNYG